VNVRSLEDRNKALKDRISNLENMLKSSITTTDNFNQDKSVNESRLKKSDTP
jgi:hypothetical protein